MRGSPQPPFRQTRLKGYRRKVPRVTSLQTSVYMNGFDVEKHGRGDSETWGMQMRTLELTLGKGCSNCSGSEHRKHAPPGLLAAFIVIAAR